MNFRWFLVSLVSGSVVGLITYFLTNSWRFSLVCGVVVFALFLIHNPRLRYINFAYVAVFPLLSNFYFSVSGNWENLDFTVAFRELNSTSYYVLGSITVICLILDYLERKEILNGTFFQINKNSSKNITGTNINITQSINKNEKSGDDE